MRTIFLFVLIFIAIPFCAILIPNCAAEELQIEGPMLVTATRGHAPVENASTGDWIMVYADDFDFGDFTIKITQNGETTTECWNASNLERRETIGGVVGSDYNTSEKKLLCVEYFGSTQYSTLRYCTENCTEEFGTPRRLEYTFLVTDSGNGLIKIEISGIRSNVSIAGSKEIEVTPQKSAILTFANQIGAWDLPDGNISAGSLVHVYGIGFTGDVRLKMSQGKFLEEHTVTTWGRVAYFAWHVPGNMKPGNCIVSISGADFTGSAVSVAKTLRIEEPPKATVPGFEVLMLVGAISAALVLGRRRK